MEKILVNVFVPVLESSFDVFVPVDVPISSVIAVVSEGVIDLEGYRYSGTGMEQLMVAEPPMLLSPERTLEQYGVCDGSRLILL